ncbi:MAG: hypothetical protein KDA63_07125 [Planctomycetales bacterium]|nr:hypothetical protein [Planctomycetales bacterium]
MASSPPQETRHEYDDAVGLGEVVEYEHFIDEQIEKTSSQVRWIDITAALMTLAAGWLGFLLLAALVDQWVVTEGLGHVARFACFSALVGGTVLFTVWRIAPLVVRRINPVYAAHVIEREEPSLKNSLVNFLLLRAAPRHLTRKTYQALEESAAHGLADVPVEHIVDRSSVIRVGYVLMAVIAAGCLYKLASPKDPLRSVGRIVVPWSDLAPASRVTIDEVEPGSVSVFHGQFVDVSAVISGAGADEPVTVYYSTNDTRVVDRPIVMQRPEGSFRHQATLPEEVDGFEQDVEYYIAAGDARTPTYRVSVSTPPAIVVERVEYSYPAYTGLGTRTVDGGGDLKAIEGTRVKLTALANREIDGAYVDFQCDGRSDVTMTVDADRRRATTSFTLETAEDRVSPKYDSYQLRFSDDVGQENPRPTRHRIEVIPDTPPEVHFERPGYDGVEVPENATLRLEIHAQDSDFSLGEVTLFAERDGRKIVEQRLLREPHVGEFVAEYDFAPSKYRLHDGDELMYWAEARDMRQPVANRAETVRYRMVIVGPQSTPPPQQEAIDPQDGNSSEDAEGGDGKNPDDAAEAAGRDAQPGQDDAAQQSGDKPNNEQDASAEKDAEADDAAQDDATGNDENDDSADRHDDQPNRQQQSPDSDAAGSQSGSEQQGGSKTNGAGGTDNESGKAGEDGKSGGRDAGDSERQGKPIDPTTNPGDAFEEILRRRDETRDENKNDIQGGADGRQSGDNKKSHDNEQANNKPDDAQSRDGEQGGDAGDPSDRSDDAREPRDGQSQGNTSEQQRSRQDQSQGGRPDASDGQNQSPNESPEQPANSNNEQTGNGQQVSAKQNTGQQNNDQQNGGQTQDNQEDGGQQGDGQQGDGQQSGGQQPGDNQQPGTSGQESTQPGESNNAAKRDPGQQAPGQAGGQQKDSAQQPGSSGKPTSNGQQPEDGQQQDPAAGREDQEGSTVENSDRDDPAGSMTRSQKPSEAQGGQQGDRSGRGQEGSGQKSDQSGTGGAGQNTAADQGGGASQQPGEGPTGSRPGDTPGQPGQSGQQQQGNGNQQRPGGQQSGGQQSGGQQAGGQQAGGQQAGQSPAGGQQPGGQQGTSSSQGQGAPGQGGPGQGSPGQESPANGAAGGSGSSADNTGSDSTGAEKSDEPRSSGQGEGRGGSGEPPDDPNEPLPRDDEAFAAAEAQRLAEAREATNLALEYLRDQLAKEQPDQELLDRLGWTREQMERFLAHWEEMNRAAQQPGDEGGRAQNRLDKMLRGLGLSRQRHALGSGGVDDDRRGNLSSQRRVAPPRQYADQYKAYTEGAARGRDGK